MSTADKPGEARLRVRMHLHGGAEAGADGEHVTLPREAISCPLCEEQYATAEPRTPCVLPCFHSFCRQCLQGWAGQGAGGAPAAAAGAEGAGSFSCPTCRAECATPVGSLQVNFALMTVVEAERTSTGQTRLVCQECEDDATHYCQVCSKLMCDDCTKCHRKGKNTKEHALLTTSEFKERKQAPPKQKRTCKKHTDQAVCVPSTLLLQPVALHRFACATDSALYTHSWNSWTCTARPATHPSASTAPSRTTWATNMTC